MVRDRKARDGGFVGAMLVVVLIGVLGAGALMRSDKSEQWVEHTYIVLRTVDEVNSGLFEAIAQTGIFILQPLDRSGAEFTFATRKLLVRDESPAGRGIAHAGTRNVPDSFYSIVEDEPTEAALIARELKRVGLSCNYHRVDTEAAFRHGLQSIPDLVMSDFSMPKFDGMSALRIARAEFPEVPFIIVSGTLGEERAIDALKSGATDYVLKNNLARLAPAVIRALKDVEARRVIRQAEQRFRDLVQTSQDWVWELDGRAVHCDR